MELRNAVAIAALSSALVGAVVVGCSLALDESKIANRGDAEAPSADAGRAEASGPAPTCTTNADCVAPVACLVGRCDTVHNACLFDPCPTTSACQAATCTGSGTCGTPATYGFHANSYSVAAAGIGCGGVLSRCFAVVWPYVFVGTTNGVVATSTADPGNGPLPVNVSGVSFAPSFISASGRRIYFFGNLGPAQTPNRILPVAVIDVPGNPFVASLQARSFFVRYPAGTSAIGSALAAPDMGEFLISTDGTNSYPTALLAANATDLTTVSAFSLTGIPANAAPVGTSGGRIMAARQDQTPGVNATFFTLIGAAATPAAQVQGTEVNATPLGTLGPQLAFAQGDDGSILMNAIRVAAVDGGTNIAAVRTAWLVDNPTAPVDPTRFVDVETYAVPPVVPGVPVAGPLTWIDPNTVLSTASSPDDVTQTVVQVASRSGATPSVVPSRRLILPVAAGSLGIAHGNGFGFVLAPDPGGLVLHMVAPNCDP